MVGSLLFPFRPKMEDFQWRGSEDKDYDNENTVSTLKLVPVSPAATHSKVYSEIHSHVPGPTVYT